MHSATKKRNFMLLSVNVTELSDVPIFIQHTRL